MELVKLELAEPMFAFLATKGCLLVERRYWAESFGNWLLRYHGGGLDVLVVQDRGFPGAEVEIPGEPDTGTWLGSIMESLGLMDSWDLPKWHDWNQSVEALADEAAFLDANWALIIRFLNEAEYKRARANRFVWTEGAIARSIRGRVLSSGWRLVVPPGPFDR